MSHFGCWFRWVGLQRKTCCKYFVQNWLLGRPYSHIEFAIWFVRFLIHKRIYGITVTVTRMTRMTRSTQALCILIRATEHSLGKLLLHVRGESNVRRYSRNVSTATSNFGLCHWETLDSTGWEQLLKKVLKILARNFL